MLNRIMLTFSLLIWAPVTFAQQGGGFDPQGMAKKALAEPFAGLTSDGYAKGGLFKISPTGVSTASVINAANSLLVALNNQQRQQISFPVGSDAWRNWANIHHFPREGVSLADMTETQRTAAYTLLRASLSARGYETSRDIMHLNHHLAELVNNFTDYGEHLYWFAIMGTPSRTEPWGWQIEGHHLIINYFVLGDQVVMTPTFMGSEPVVALSGKYQGTAILENEQDAGLSFMQALPPELQKTALIGSKEGRSDNLSEMFKDNITVPYEGISAKHLNENQKEQLLRLTELFISNISNGHATVKMSEVREHIDETYFGWRGDIGADAVFYYRIQSPVIFIEFDHQGPIALDGPRGTPTRRHIHTVVRTPNGNDYGRDLLRQHLETHH
tara:strand:+ start:246 stop:1403 length:1158 start_codon:yes stop_codon:yes gene_type:complete